MPRLIPEILLDVGKQLVKDGDSEAAVMNFALSGKESFTAMKQIFASVTTLKLYNNHYVYGWGTSFKSYDGLCETLLRYVGNFVESLHLDVDYRVPASYRNVVEKIAANNRLVTLSIGSYCPSVLLDQLLPRVCTTLKHVTIPSTKMTAEFRDSCILDSLTILDHEGYNFMLYCCQTTSLNFAYSNETSFTQGVLAKFNHTVPGYNPVSPHLSTIKMLTFDEPNFYMSSSIFVQIMKRFPALESIQQNLGIKASKNYYFATDENIFFTALNMVGIIKDSNKFPPKMTCFFYKCDDCLKFPDLERLKLYFVDYEFDESNAKFYSFRKPIQSSNPSTGKTTVLDIQITK